MSHNCNSFNFTQTIRPNRFARHFNAFVTRHYPLSRSIAILITKLIPFRFGVPYRVAVQLLHDLAFSIHEVVHGQAALRVVRAGIIGHHSAGYTESAANRRQDTGEDPALPVFDRLLCPVILLEYLLRAHPSRRRGAALIIVRPISHHRPVVVRGIHLQQPDTVFAGISPLAGSNGKTLFAFSFRRNEPRVKRLAP